MLAASTLFDLSERTALVTGGATGIGRICAEALLSSGARVLIASRKAEACEAAAKELSAIGPCEGFGGTVATEAGVAALATETRSRTSNLHVLVNNAGLTWGAPFETYPWKAFDRIMSVNVAGLFALTRDLAPMLAASATADRPSTIVNIGSVMGAVTQSENSWAYSASKAAVHHLTKSLAAEWGARGVRVNAVAPTYINTPMTALAKANKAMFDVWIDGTPMGRIGEPDEIASVVLFLASDAASLMTGSVVVADAGYSCW